MISPAASPADQAKRAALLRLWANVEAAPDDELLHQKFVRFAVESELYLPAIEQYKALAARDPARTAQADRWKKAIGAQAAAKVMAAAPREKPAPKNRALRIFVALSVGSALATVLARACTPATPSGPRPVPGLDAP